MATLFIDAGIESKNSPISENRSCLTNFLFIARLDIELAMMKIAKYALEYYLSTLLEKSRPLSFRFHFFRIGGSGSKNRNIASAARCKNDERLRENAHNFFPMLDGAKSIKKGKQS